VLDLVVLWCCLLACLLEACWETQGGHPIENILFHSIIITLTFSLFFGLHWTTPRTPRDFGEIIFLCS
jgi:hypothetical protein